MHIRCRKRGKSEMEEEQRRMKDQVSWGMKKGIIMMREKKKEEDWKVRVEVPRYKIFIPSLFIFIPHTKRSLIVIDRHFHHHCQTLSSLRLVLATHHLYRHNLHRHRQIVIQHTFFSNHTKTQITLIITTVITILLATNISYYHHYLSRSKLLRLTLILNPYRRTKS